MKINSIKQITIIGDSYTDDQKALDFAYKTGKYCAEKGYILISGGMKGIMEAASRGSFENKGITIGITPGIDRGNGNSYLTAELPSGIGYARNLPNILAGDIIIAIGGGAGTLCEIAYAWQFKKTIFAYEKSNGWSTNLINIQIDKKRKNCIIPISTASELDMKINSLFK